MKVEDIAVVIHEVVEENKSLSETAHGIALKVGTVVTPDFIDAVEKYRNTRTGLEDCAKVVKSHIPGSISDIDVKLEPANPNVITWPDNKFNESKVWKAPEKGREHWSLVDLALELCEQASGGMDVYEGCIKETVPGEFDYEDSEISLSLHTDSFGELERKVIEERRDYMFECWDDIAKYGLTGIDEMGLDERMECAYSPDDTYWIRIPGEDAVLVCCLW